MITRYCLSVLLLAATSGLTQAQVFEPGYLVNFRGDTLRGEVENAFWSNPPKLVRYRATPQTSSQTYQASQLRSVALASGRLLRYELLPLDRSAQTDIQRLPKGLHFQQHPDSVMADVLVDGPAKLLAITLDDVHHYFVRRPQQPWLEMTERLYVRAKQSVVADGNDYQNQLRLYFLDFPAVVAQIENTPFTPTGMIGLVQAYNQRYNTPGEINKVYYEPEEVGRRRVATSAGLLLGTRFNSMRLQTNQAPGVEPFTLQGIDADGRLHVQGGAYVDITHPARRTALHIDAVLSRYGRTGTIPASPNGQVPQGTFAWGGTLLSNHISLRGMRPVGPYQAFAGMGIEVMYKWRDKGVLRYGTTPQRRAGDGSVIGTSSSFEYGFRTTFFPYLEAGVKTGRLSFSVNGRLYGKGYYLDDLIVRNPNESYLSRGYEYSARTWSLGLVMGLRLLGKPDAKLR